MKRCSRCKQLLELADFYKNRRKKDSVISHCKMCSSAACKKWYAANSEKTRVAQRKRYKINSEKRRAAARRWSAANLEKVRASRRVSAKTWAIANPKKVFAVQAVSSAIKAGVLIRQPCENCGREKAEGHHEDYKQPLEVVWLCSGCHGQLHRYKRELLA